MSSIKLVKGSCVEQEVDAIVNATNKFLLSGSGVCGEIFRKAGYFELSDACKKVPTPLSVGDAIVTPAFNIKNCKCIIHAVGPDFGRTPDAFLDLKNAYYNSLVLLRKINLHTISFPLISSGIYAGDLENPAIVSAKMCLDAYKEFINTFYDYDIEVLLCAYSDNEYESIKGLFN